MKELPKINQLRNFQSIVRYGSIRTASQATFQTQPAMTRSLQELEKILGVTLLARGAQGIVLTEMGRLFEPRVNMLLNDLEKAIEELHQTSQLSQGSVVFGCSHLPAFSIVPTLINEFQMLYPTVTITIIEGQLSELITSLRLGRIEFYLGIASPEISMNEFYIENSFPANFCVMARKGHPLSMSTSLKQLKGSKWYFPNARIGYYNILEKHIFPEGRDMTDSVIFGDSMLVGEQLVLNKDYLFVGPEAILKVGHINDVVSVIPVKESIPSAEYILIYKQQVGLTPMAKVLMDRINKTCADFFSV